MPTQYFLLFKKVIKYQSVTKTDQSIGYLGYFKLTYCNSLYFFNYTLANRRIRGLEMLNASRKNRHQANRRIRGLEIGQTPLGCSVAANRRIRGLEINY